MPRLLITVNHKELNALVELALQELRNPRDQARFLIQQELFRCGLLTKEPKHLDAAKDLEAQDLAEPTNQLR